MKTGRKRTAFDDLVFQYRNREYGAYQLRKKYWSALSTGLIISVLTGAFTVLLPFIISSNPNRNLPRNERSVTLKFGDPDSPQQYFNVPDQAPQIPEMFKREEITENIKPLVIDTFFFDDNILPAFDQILAFEGLDTTSVYSGLTGESPLTGAFSTEEEPLRIAEIMPSFRGGDEKEFHNWVQSHTIFPEEAVRNRIRGTVVVTFVVEKNGDVSNVTVVRGIHPLLDNEAVRVVSSSPAWNPGYQYGQPVRVIYILPIIFSY